MIHDVIVLPRPIQNPTCITNNNYHDKIILKVVLWFLFSLAARGKKKGMNFGARFSKLIKMLVNQWDMCFPEHTPLISFYFVLAGVSL